MSPERNPAVACEPDLVLLHPAGSSDPQRVSLAIGLLEWLRLWLESRGVHSSLWPETVTDARGLRHFILRPTPWKPTDLRHKIQLVPTADAIVTLDFEADRSRIRLLDRRGDSLAASVIRLVPEDLLSVLPDTLDQLLGALDRPHSPLTGKELFKTEDGRTAIAALYALERFVAFRFGVGRDDPNRLFEPILQCLEREPSHPIARECMTRIAASLALSTAEGDRQAAFHAIGRWAELAPHSPVPLFHMAVLKQQAGDAEGARGAYTESLLRDPFYLPSLQGYAEWLASHGFLDQSVDLLTRAVGRTGFDGNLLDHAGCLLANQGRTEAAEPLFRRAVKAAGPATAYTNLARALLSLGRDDEALEVAQAGWMQSPEPDQLDLLSEIAERPGLAGASARAILRGRISEGSEDESVLEKLMRVSVEIDGLAAGAATARKLLEVASRPEVRRAAYAVLLESRMEDFDSRWEKAVADAVQGDAEAARAFFADVVREEPSFAQARFLLASALERLGRMREALPHLEQAANEEDDALILDLLARARFEAGDAPGAAQAHHRAAALAPQNARILRNAAVSLVQAGFPQEAREMAAASLALMPDQPELVEMTRKMAARASMGAAPASEPGRAGRFGRLRRLLRKPFVPPRSSAVI